MKLGFFVGSVQLSEWGKAIIGVQCNK